MELKNTEGLKIELRRFGPRCDGTVVEVDGFSYCCFQFLNIDDIDTNKLVTWIENTYHDLDYKDDFYMPCNLNDYHFRKESES